MTRHLIGLVLTALWLTAQTAPAPLSAPSGASFYGLTPQFALSPDGRKIAAVVSPASGSATLWVQPVNGGTPRALVGTEQASYPFWSADGRFVGFFSAGKLKTVAATGGAVAIVCDAPTGRGGTWNALGVILFASGIGDPIRRVAATGGQPVPATLVDTARENSHRWPQFLPDGVHFLFWAGAGSVPPALKVGSLDNRETVPVATADANGAIAAGTLFYGNRGVLMAQPFDAATLRSRGDPVRVVEPLSGDAGSNFASFAVSASGTLLYTRGTARPLVLTWFDRSGKKIGTVGAPGQYTNVAISPDGKRIAVSLTAGVPANRDVWMLDAASGNADRLTSDPAVDATPIWSPDGIQIAFSSQRAGPYQIYRRAATVEGGDELVFKSDTPAMVTDWARDGKRFVYIRGTAATGMELWTLPLSGDRVPAPFIQSLGAYDNAVFSPDGRWIAYQSNESGRDEIYARPVDEPLTHAPLRNGPSSMLVRLSDVISHAGGTQPLWRADGRELFYLAPDRSVMVAALGTGAAPFDGIVLRKLFAAPVSLVIRRSYTVTADGQRFLIPILDDSNPPVITVDAWPKR